MMKGESCTYRPEAGSMCLISPPNCDDGNGYVFMEAEVLWTDDTFLIYRKPGCYPCVNKWVHVICKPMVPDNQNTGGVKMKSIYAIAYMTENLDGEKDLYVGTMAASSREEAVGLSMLEYMGNEITAKGEKILMINVDEHDPQDVAAMVKENEAEPSA
jgi:hypothetical protein